MINRKIILFLLVLAYSAALALILDPHVLPGLVKAAYRGESWEPLNRMLDGRSQYPLDHYMTKWHALSRRLVIALIGAAAATLAARLAWGRSRQVILVAVMAPLLASVAVLLASKSHHDYFLHLKMWERTLAGGDPWAIDTWAGYSTHAYGPLFNLLAIPVALDPFAPKVLFALVWVATIASLACRDRGIALAVAPMGLWEATLSGRFDILVAIGLVAGLRDYRAGRDRAAGVWLGAGFLLKLVPLAVVPFLVLDGRRLRWKLALLAIATSAIGFAIAFGVWGWTSPLRPLLFNSQRPSGGVSLFSFARNAMGIDLDRGSGPLVAMSLAALLAWAVARRPAPVPTSLAALGLILAFHKFGATAYPVMLAVPVAWYVTEETDQRLRKAAILYAGWASACIIIVQSMRMLNFGETGDMVMYSLGLPTCLVTLALVAALLRRARGVSSTDADSVVPTTVSSMNPLILSGP